jgi:hypothetical protein
MHWILQTKAQNIMAETLWALLGPSGDQKASNLLPKSVPINSTQIQYP